MTGVREAYHRELALRGYRSDPGQLAVVGTRALRR
jgi:hypothetical protein